MSHLKKIFLKNFYKNWFQITLGSIICLYLVGLLHRFKDLSFNTTVFTLLYIVLTLPGILAPLHPLLKNTKFAINLKYLINQGFNRKDLFKYHLIFQCQRIILALITYILIHTNYKIVLSLFDLKELVIYKNFILKAPTFDFSLFNLLFILFWIFVFICFMFAGYLLKTETVPQQVQRKSPVFKKFEKLTPLFKFITIVFIAFIIHLIIKYGIPLIAIFTFGFISLIIISFNILNKAFKFYPQAKQNKYNLRIFYFTPLLLILSTTLLIIDVNDSKISLENKARSVVFLDYLYQGYSKDQKVELINSKTHYYSDLIIMFNKDLDFKSIVDSHNSDYKLKVLLNIVGTKLSLENNQYLINHFDKYIKNQNKKESYALRLNSYFKKQYDIPDSYLHDLAQSNSNFKKFASMRLAQNMMSLKEFEHFYQLYKSNLSPFVKTYIENQKKYPSK